MWIVSRCVYPRDCSSKLALLCLVFCVHKPFLPCWGWFCVCGCWGGEDNGVHTTLCSLDLGLWGLSYRVLHAVNDGCTHKMVSELRPLALLLAHSPPLFLFSPLPLVQPFYKHFHNWPIVLMSLSRISFPLRDYLWGLFKLCLRSWSLKWA